MTTIGRCGKRCRSKTAKNGCAARLTPAQDNTPAFSRRRARDRTAGVCETLANKLLVALTAEFCAKHQEGRSRNDLRQEVCLGFIFRRKRGEETLFKGRESAVPRTDWKPFLHSSFCLHHF